MVQKRKMQLLSIAGSTRNRGKSEMRKNNTKQEQEKRFVESHVQRFLFSIFHFNLNCSQAAAL